MMTIDMQESAIYADDPESSKVLMVLEYGEGGALFSGNRMTPNKRISELLARQYFRDILQVSPRAGLAQHHLLRARREDIPEDAIQFAHPRRFTNHIFLGM